MLALAGFLGSLPKPTAWPIHTGLGGLVGFMLWDKIELLIGSVLYVVLALGLAGALCLVAMGARWHESAWVVGRVLAGSLWAGRHVGRAAAWSGSAVAERYRASRSHEDEAPAPTLSERLGGLPGAGLSSRLRGSGTNEPDLEPEPLDPTPGPNLPRVRMRRPGPSRAVL